MYISQETASLLGKIALDGLWSGYIRLSEEIFQNLIPLRPHSCGPILGLAMCYAHRGDYQKGVDILENMAFPAFEEDPHLLAWYGFMLTMNKNNARGRAVLEKLMQKDTTPEDAKNMAHEILTNLG